MLSRSKLVRLAFVLLAALAFAGMTTPSRAQNASIRIHLVRAGFIVGVSGGSGTLIFHGHSYPLTVGGVSLGATFGASSADLRGVVHNIRHPGDIIGTYSASGAGVAFVGGRTAATLVNGNGVVLVLRGPQIGFQISLDLSGMQIGIR
jgi:hypothetical protein